MRSLGRRRRLALAGIAAAIALPIVHVAFETVAIAKRGDLVYGMRLQPGGSIEHFTHVIGQMSTALGSHIGWILFSAVCVGILVSVLRGRPDWIPTGLFVTAAGALAWSAQSGFAASRYFIPTIALLAVALVLLVASLPPAPRWLATGVSLVIAVSSLASARAHVTLWAAGGRDADGFVVAVADAKATGCPVVITGLDIERRIALPVLVALRRGERSTCSSGAVFVGLGTNDPDPAFRGICLTQGRQVLKRVDLALERVVFMRCAGVRPGSESLVLRSQLR